ncbi:MAG: transketolase family protein [Carnobacterium sp.]|nr:transketolase family protein [Carnobacterium sp.]
MKEFKVTLDEAEMRTTYANFLVDFAKKDEKVVALEADLSSAIATNKIKKAMGNRLINVGIMEAEEVGCAAGLAVAGFKPFIHTFGPFASRRVYDQVFLSLNYAQLSAVILGSDAGVTAEANGGTHMPFEDLALMRAIPKATVYEVSDTTMLRAILEQSYEDTGFSYIRTIRKQPVKLYSEGELFESGIKVLREGKDVSILASGIMVSDAMLAANELAAEGIEATVMDVYRLKPINKEAVLQAAETGAIITAENHNIVGGLGSAIAEVLAEEKPTLQYRIGVREQFGQVGKADYLKEQYGLTVENIVSQAKQLIKKKEKMKTLTSI